MEKACKELDEVKAEMEKLKVEFQIKAELLESMKKAYDVQLIKFQAAKIQIDKQARELNANSTEISDAKQIYKDLKSSLQEKESVVRQLTLANEKLRGDCAQKVQKLEGENGELHVALDEASARNKDFEQRICACAEEIDSLKKLLSEAEKKCYEAEQKAQLSKELRQRDQTIETLEEEYRNVQDQLKWKKEQFKHLEEAHKKLQDQFWSSKDEWKREKLALLEEISSLQTSLDSQTRISEGLHTQLTMCNQALAHEESRRKLLEVQVSESQSLFEDVHAKCEEAQSKTETLTVQRDEGIAKLRNLLGTKDVLFKEMEFKTIHLEQENQELHTSIKELQEAQINNAGAASSVVKLRNKLRGVEHVHSVCATKLKERESEWSSQFEKMDEEMKNSLAQLKAKQSQILELQESLEGYQFSLEVLHEEMVVILLVLKSEFSVAYSMLLVDIDQKQQEVASLIKRVESKDPQMEKELESHRMLLEESSRSQHQLEEQILHMENALKNASDDLEKAKCELNKKVCETNLIEIELHKWKSMAESLQISLEGNQETQRQVETSLLAHVKTERTLKQENESLLCTVKEQRIIIANLQQQIASQETTVAANSEAMEAFKQETEKYVRIVEDKECSLDKLQKEIAGLELESVTRELQGAILARIDAERTFEHEKERLLEVIEEKNHRIRDLQGRAVLLEEDFSHAVMSSLSEVNEKQIVIDVLREALDEANYLTKVKIEEKNKTIAEIEKSVHDLQQTLQFQEESLYYSKRHTEQLEHLLEAQIAEIKNLKDQFGKEQKALEDAIKELDFEKRILLEDLMKLSSEKEDILTHLVRDCERIQEFCSEDTRVMGMLKKILQAPEENNMEVNLMVNIELGNPTEERVTELLSPTRKAEVNPDERSPLREIHNQQFV